MQTLHAAIASRTTRQLGLITRAQLGEMGITARVVRRLVDDGALLAVGTRTYRHAGVPRTWAGDVLAATIDNAAVASHRTAAALHGFDGFSSEPRPIEITVVARRQGTRSELAIVHATNDLPSSDRVLVRPRSSCSARIATTSVPRTLLGLSGLVPELDPDLVIGAVDGALQRGQTSTAALWAHLERIRRSGRNGVGVLEAVLIRRRGGRVTESWLEREFLRVLEDAGLPLPRCQLRIRQRGAFVARVDFAYDRPPVTIEVSGHATHSSRSARSADARRANALTLAGRPVLEFTYEDVAWQPSAVVATVASALGIAIAA